MSRCRLASIRVTLIFATVLVLSAYLDLVFAASLDQGTSPTGRRPNVVTINLTVQTNDGGAISDLRPADLEVEADGKPQTISSLTFTAGGTAKSAPLVILFDLLNLDPLSREQVRSELSRVLPKVQDPAHIYLYLIKKDGAIYPVHAIPAPATETRLSTDDWPMHSAEIIQKSLREANEALPFQMRESSFRIDSTFAALKNIGDLLAPIPGRKAMVWISHGVRADQLAEKVSTELDRENIAVYTVQQMSQPALAPEASDSLSDVSKWTCGLPYQDGNIQQAIAQARRDAESSYSLEFTAANKSSDGKFHKVRVSSQRPEVRVRSETGYWGFGPFSSTPVAGSPGLQR